MQSEVLRQLEPLPSHAWDLLVDTFLDTGYGLRDQWRLKQGKLSRGFLERFCVQLLRGIPHWDSHVHGGAFLHMLTLLPAAADLEKRIPHRQVVGAAPFV